MNHAEGDIICTNVGLMSIRVMPGELGYGETGKIVMQKEMLLPTFVHMYLTGLILFPCYPYPSSPGIIKDAGYKRERK